jgi:hypothetical protein
MRTPSPQPSKTFCNPFAAPTLKYVLKTLVARVLRCSLTVAFRSDLKQQKDTRVRSAPGARTRIEIARDDPTTLADATPRADDEQHTVSSEAAAETQEIKVPATLPDIYAETVWTAPSQHAATKPTGRSWHDNLLLCN